MTVALNAPAVFRFTAAADPERHRYAAGLMGLHTDDADADDVGDLLANALVTLIRQAGMPNGLSAVGYGPQDVGLLVAGALPQHTVTQLSPRPVSADDLRQLFVQSMTLW
jgi:alcohol dehydrogenase class IV